MAKTKQVTETTDHMPAVAAAFEQSHPLIKMMAQALDDLGGQDFMTDWAEENPERLIELLLRFTPQPIDPNANKAGGTNVVLNLHQGLAPGPLDKVVSDQ